MTNQFGSVWTRAPRRPRTTGLSRDQIVRAAVTLLDKEGLDALSMRKLGSELGAGATSLYWHVANKNELLELALDEIWGLVGEAGSDPAAGLRDLLTTYAHNLRATLLAHPWSATLIGQVPSIGPQAFRVGDRLRRAFAEAGFQGADAYLASGTVTSFVVGQVVPMIAMEHAHGGPVDRETAMRLLEQVSADYPEIRADYRVLVPEGNTLGFDFGLGCVLDGLEARLRAATDAGRAASSASARR
ncbi:TetR/AcrR family transcriptional regulator [Nocardia sp. NPDC024068]|uniref:TetR/AcrR family transcriptional regulator n=1 Tax=Nocardia sp. NPDC024068 TaxID=3157197 RepID=UPI0033E86B7F